MEERKGGGEKVNEQI